MKTKAILLAAMICAATAPMIPEFLPPAIAGTATGGLIDKDFEVALRKFICKRFYNKIDASSEQRQKLDGILSTTQEETRPDRELLRHDLIDISSLMSDDKVSDEEIMKKVHEVRDLKNKIMDRRLAAALEVRKVLTSDQKHKIHDRISELLGGNAKPKALGLLMHADKIGFLNGE